MNTAHQFRLALFRGAAISLLIACCGSTTHAANVRVSRFWHNHQPIYWPEWNGSDSQTARVQFAEDSIDQKSSQYYDTTTQHPDNNLTDIFGTGDRVTAYQSGPRNSLAALSSSAGFAISYSGSLIENVRSLGNAGELGYGSSWYDGYREAMGWTTPSGSRRMDMVGFAYHHALCPVLPKAVFRKEIDTFKQVWWKAWNKNSDLSDHSKGFFPTEMAFTEEMIDVLREEGYEWVIVASHHLSRTCPTYFDQGTSEGNFNINSSPPNRADLLGPSPSTGWWYNSPNPGNCAWNVSPYAYQLHKVKYVNPSSGVEKVMIAVPSDDVLSYKAGYSGADVGMVSSYIAPYASDANNPALVLPATDGDNAWGGGNSSWMESTPSFFSGCDSAGYSPTAIQDFVNQYGGNATTSHVEDGAWIFPEMCYGSPYFLKWVDPPTSTNRATCYPNTQIDLETPGFALKFWDWAPVIAGANWCETAEQILKDEGGAVDAWKIARPYDWDGSSASPNDVERAWHIYLCGLDSGFNYYGGLGNDDEVKQSLANRRALEILQPWMTSQRLANDHTPPSIFRPQRFPYNPGTNTFGWFNVVPTNTAFNKKMGSDFYVWTHAYDVSGIPDGGLVLKVRRDKDGVNTMANNQNETFAGGDDVEGWISIPMTKRTLPSTRTALNAAANNSQIDYFITPLAIADYYFAKVTLFRDALVDYYIEAQDTKGNLYKSDIQHVYVVGDGTSAGSSPSATFTPAAPSDCASLTVNFNAATSVLATATTVNAFYHFSTNSTDWTNAVMTRASTNTFTLTFAAVPDNAPQLEVCFNDGVHWESNGGANWKVTIRDCDAPVFTNGVYINPGTPGAGSGISITYDPSGRALSAATNVNIHYGYNGANWTTVPGMAMIKSNAYWTYSYTVPVAATSIVMCFNNGTTWDNNGGANWVFAVTPTSPPPPVPNGVIITNPAASTTTVAYAVSNCTLQGTAGTNLTGSLRWTNSASAAGGTFTRESYWSRTMDLAVGDNALTISAAIAGTGSGLVTNASDNAANAAYSGGWTNGSNGGTGFGSWTLYAGTNAGHFVDATNGFGFWTHEGGNLAEAVRPLGTSLATGQTFRVRMKNGWIWESGGSVGVALRDASGSTLWQLYFNGGDSFYNIPSGATDIGWTDQGLDLAFSLTATNAYSVEITPVGGSTRVYTGTLSNSVAQFRAWSYNNGTTDTNNFHRDYFVNHLAVTVSAGGESYSSATVHVIRESGGAQPPNIQDVDPVSGSNGLQFTLTNSVSGAQYAVYSSLTLIPTQNWQIVTQTIETGTGGAMDLTLTNGLLPTNYYRVGYILP